MATLVGRRPQPAPRLKSARRLATFSTTPPVIIPAAATMPAPSSATSKLAAPPPPQPAPRAPPATMPMAQLGFEGSRHLEPDRLPSGRHERARTVRVIDLNQDTITSLKQIADGLRRLDLSSLKLETLSEELIECLSGLERLDIGFNRLTDESIPACFGKLENLIELSAHYNKLSSVPKTLRKLKNVSRLKLGHNQLDNLDGVERLRKLQVLVVEDNCLENVPREMYQNLKKLEMWHVGHNQLKVI